MDTGKLKEIDRELAKLLGKRENRFCRVQRLHDMTDKLDDPKVLKEFTVLLGNLDATEREFNDIMDRIVELNLLKNDRYEVDYKPLDSFQDVVCHIRAAAQTMGSSTLCRDGSESVPLAQLPKIELPEFSGDPLKWPVFYDTFRSLIHENQRLDNVAKVYYLMGCIKGRALEACSGLPPTAANYSIMWNLLVSKFQDKRLLADSYLQKILEFRPLSIESPDALNLLADRCDTSYRALKRLNLPDLADFCFASLTLSKLDPFTRKNFEMSNHSELPSHDEVIRFIHRQADALKHAKKTNDTKASFVPIRKTPKSTVLMTNQADASTVNNRPCAICRGSHAIYLCSTFSEASVEDRWRLVVKHHLCENCLSNLHKRSSCRSTVCCRFCNEHHHSMLHQDSTDNAKEEGSENRLNECIPQVHNLCSVQSQASSRTFSVLPTAVINIVTKNGEFPARFLIDSASQAHLITIRCCRRAQIKISKGPSCLGGIGGTLQSVRGHARFGFASKFNPQVLYEIDALVLPRITDQMPATQICKSQRDQFKNLPLADDRFDEPGNIDGVIGAALFAQLLDKSNPVHCSSGPSAVPTKLGHIVMGVATSCYKQPVTQGSNITSLCTVEVPDLDLILRKFWEVEEVESLSDSTIPDECEDLFSRTTYRTKEGKYCVRLPFSEIPPNLGDSFLIAKKRLHNLEQQFRKSENLKQKYHEGIQDYINQGHITEVPLDKDSSYIIPHFAVFKESSSTPLRIVFDASCRTTNGRSLNDVLLTGPKLQTDIQQLLLRFRLHPIAVVADIRQMYRNIVVHPEHRRYQRLLWRFDPEQPIKCYQINCLPFGLSPAPFLALRTVRQLAKDEESTFPLASRIALKDMYVDDVVTSVPREESSEVYPQLTRFFKAGGFSLVKWSTNSPEVAKTIPNQDQLIPTKSLEEPVGTWTGVKVLGLNWSSQDDCFFFAVQGHDKVGTKRQILSTLARIWDPLGFLAPVTLLCKLMIKKLWLSNCGWDEAPPASVAKTWSQFTNEISALSQIRIPRYSEQSLQDRPLLVGFADSSERGYGAVIYLVTKLNSGKTISTLLMSKSKVTPIKPCSIPRLELCAAVLLSKIFKLVLSVFSHVPLDNTYAFSDSEDVLHWLSKNPYHWKTFVANRVAKIQGVIPYDRWFHISSEENIADCISRGLTPLRLVVHPTWISGPRWLTGKVEEWPVRKVTKEENTAVEVRPVVAAVTTPAQWFPIDDLILRSSSWIKLCHVVVYVLRFGKRLPVRPRIIGTDLEKAEMILIRKIQNESFKEELTLLTLNKPLPVQIRSLSPFVEDGCIRVGGRLNFAPVSPFQKHPYLLPKHHHLVDILIDYHHRLHLHAGPTLLLSLLRQRYWILSARSVIRKRIRLCYKCFRYNPTNVMPPMGNLPIARVTAAKPFVSCGVDYAGPFRVTLGRYRGVRSQKAYICLFVCMATKAIHIELASDLSTEAFLMCFKRFVARRGPVSAIYSDCGTNFVGAKSRLDELNALVHSQEFKDKINDTLNLHKIEWHFNPPSAPHFGGLWESNIKSVKKHLFRVMGTQLLSFEEFQTLLTQIEALLNSRPLCVLSTDPTEPEALTPAHFLTLTPLRSLPAISTPSVTLKTRKEILDALVRSYWKRWHLEYLSTLHPKKKWTNGQGSLSVGTAVLIREDNSPPLHWPLGVIENVYPGVDGIVRVVDVRVRGAVLKRPVVKLFPLPVQ